MGERIGECTKTHGGDAWVNALVNVPKLTGGDTRVNALVNVPKLTGVMHG